MILQLDPSILVETPMGTGLALFVIEKEMQQNPCWIIALANEGIIKQFDCNDINISENHICGLNLIRIKEFKVNVVSNNRNIEK